MLKYRMNTDSNSAAIRKAVILCARMNKADFAQFVMCYADEVERQIGDNYHKRDRHPRNRIDRRGGLNKIIICKMLNYSLGQTAEVMEVAKPTLRRYLYERGLRWTDLLR